MRGHLWRLYLGVGGGRRRARLRWHRPPLRAPWWLIAAAQGLFVAGDALFSVLALGGAATAVPDGLYLGAHLLLGAVGLHPSMAGLMRVIERAEAERRRVLARTVRAAEEDRLRAPGHLRPCPRRHLGLVAMPERVEMAGGRFQVDAHPGAWVRVQAMFRVSSAA